MRSSERTSEQRALILRLIDEAYDRTAWHGPNLRGVIRRLSVEQAVWRPGPGRRNTAEIVVHCAYWKYAVRRRIRGDKRGSFPLKGSNWFALPAELTKEQWRDYAALLDDEHQALREAVAAAPWSRLSATVGNRRESAAYVYGIAMHDTYHAGQIRVLKALFKQATKVGTISRK